MGREYPRVPLRRMAALGRFFICIMLTRKQKEESVKHGKELLQKSRNLILVDFSRAPAEAMRRLRRVIKDKQSQLKVIKKRLLGLVLKAAGADFDSAKFKTSVGAVFVSGEITDVAGDLYKFSKENEGFKMLGGYNLQTKEFVSDELLNRIGQLPSREVLLAQLLGMFTAPMRKFLIVLNEKGKKVVA
ncbi:50S ribosomal protein L10 [Candidatus Wolfebacteria bacterium RIFCSPLOWO2_01_FULL_45_19]|uniref:Large ribosomal subunit protein uL10 n=1 Tax=Candidatus Wolfebacteria bacterium RIFCSPLOWO2_01_FULL_45_19 TaxID=1802557 RepID=A0A1F8DSH2_9BACT|nr:MAG: 50S ribosomal protein L10 [Parcubacteria group bacterium GW2011_GWB1_45_9]OGM91583.1 MAG: 50S ribosomal protein L10 [Candidatus Wolfebacteria bacterium RIFCSPLOWO2_01_FULL_45_19]